MGLGPTLFTDREGRMSGCQAGCLGVREGPDVQALARGRMSGLSGRMSGLVELALLLSGWTGPDVRAEGPDVRGFGRRRMSGVMAGCPGCLGSLLCSLDCTSGGLGWRPDFRCGGPDVRAGRRMSGPCSFCCRPVAEG